MAIVRTRSLSSNPTPPPSPIPTAKGSRSASNEPFARFLDDSLRVPELSLPPSHSTDRRRIPAGIDLRSLVSSGPGDAADQILRSVKELGVVGITGHGISMDELRWLMSEELGEWDSGNSERGCNQVLRGVFDRNRNPKEITWLSSSSNEPRESLPKLIGNQRHRQLSENMKNVVSKLEPIAEKLTHILSKNVGDHLNNRKGIFEGKESVLSLHRYNHRYSMEQSRLTLNNEKESELSDNFLSLHLPFEHCQIYVQSDEDHFYFDAGPETLVVTIGKQLEEWILQEFKCVSGKMTFVPAEIRESPDNYSFSIELKYFSSSNSNNVLHGNCNTISIGHQIVIAIVITLLYKIFVFLTSHISGA